MIHIEYPQKLPLNIFLEESFNQIKDFICYLCKGVYFNPVIDTCGHIFCENCLKRYDQSLRMCPITEEILPANPHKIKLIGDIIDKQVIYCFNKEKGCCWIGQLLNLNEHLNKKCRQELKLCPVKGCFTQLQFDEYDSHVTFCSLVSCNFCKSEMSIFNLKCHYNICPKYQTECPYKCNEQIERKLIEDHITNECLNSQIDCQYRHLGCNAIIFRRDINKHNRTDQAEHLDMIFPDLMNRLDLLPNNLETLITEIETFSSLYKKQMQFESYLRISQQESMGLLGKKRNLSPVQRVLKIMHQPIFKINQGNDNDIDDNDNNSSFFDNSSLIKGLLFNGNKVTCDTSPTEHRYAFCNFNINSKDKITQWKIKIIKYSQWIGLGVCDKQKVIDNKMCFYSIMKKPLNHGSYLISTNGHMWNCNYTEENNKQIPILPINQGDIVDFSYNPISYELQFKHKNYSSKISQVKGTNLVCCIVFLNIDNEVKVIKTD